MSIDSDRLDVDLATRAQIDGVSFLLAHPVVSGALDAAGPGACERVAAWQR